MWYSYRPIPTVAAAWANRYLKQNASEAGHHRVDNCCPFGSRHSHRTGSDDLLYVQFPVDCRAGCIRYLSPTGADHITSGNVCLPAHRASTKVAGGIDYDYVVPAFDSTIFRRLIVVRAAEGNATTADDPSQQHLKLQVHTIRRIGSESRKPLECGGPTPLF